MKKLPQKQGKPHKYKAMKQLMLELRFYKHAWESAQKVTVDKNKKSVITYFR